MSIKNLDKVALALALLGGGGGSGANLPSNLVTYNDGQSVTPIDVLATVADINDAVDAYAQQAGFVTGDALVPFVATISEDNNSYVINKTFSEITTALSGDRKVYICFEFEDDETAITEVSVSSEESIQAYFIIDKTIFLFELTNEDALDCRLIKIAEEPTSVYASATQGVGNIVLTSDMIAVYDEALSYLTVSCPSNGMCGVKFISGSTPTVLSINAILPDGFVLEANKRYEIIVWDGFATVSKWAVS